MKQTGPVIKPDKRSGFLVVDGETIENRDFVVVASLNQVAAAVVADAVLARRLKLDVIRATAVAIAAGAPAGDPLDEVGFGHLDLDDRG